VVRAVERALSRERPPSGERPPGYTSNAAATNGIASVKTNAAAAKVDAETGV
jgi:hypothetical protein